MRKNNKKFNKEDHLLSQIEELRKSFISEPTRKFIIGDRVRYGNHDESYVTEVIDGGKIYRLHNTDVRTENNQPIQKVKDFIVAWHQILPYREKEQFGERFSKDPDYIFQFMQQDISGLFIYWYQFGVDTDMDYQRPLVWTLKDKKDLIDSIFNNVEIGKFALVFKGYGVKGGLYEMLDGKQRLNALIEFFEDRFEWRGLKFSELHPIDQNHFESFSISVAATRQPLPQKKKYEYFLRLNTSGKPQDKKHLQKVLNMFQSQR